MASEPRCVAVWFSRAEIELITHMLGASIMSLLRAASSKDAAGIGHDERADMLSFVIVRMQLQLRYLDAHEADQVSLDEVQQ